MRRLITSVLMLALASAVVAGQKITLTNFGGGVVLGAKGLVGWWVLGADYRSSEYVFNDLTFNSNSGTAALTPVFSTGPNGEINRAFYVGSSSNQRVSITGFPVIDNCAQSDYSLCFWLKVSPNPPDWARFLVYGDLSSCFCHWRCDDNDKLIVQNRYGEQYTHIYSLEPIDDGEWHYLCYTHYWGSGRETRRWFLYVDNIYQGETTWSADYYLDGDELYLGSNVATCAGVYICDVKMFNYLLSEDERTTLYQTGNPGILLEN